MAEPVLIRYTAPVEGKRLYKAPSGRKYRFGGSAREAYVMAEDADYFVQMKDFEVVQKPPAPPVMKASPTPPQAESPDLPLSELPLTEVKGVGPASARKLKEAGISTVGALALADPALLVGILGFSLNRAKGIVGAAKEL